MLKQLGKGITIVNAAAFVTVILIGGVSIFLTNQNLKNTNQIQKISSDIIKIDDIHADSYKLVRDIHHFLLEEDTLSAQEARQGIKDLTDKIEAYIMDEKEERSLTNLSEIAHLQQMLEDVKELTAVEDLLNTFKEKGTYDSDDLRGLEAFSYDIEEVATLVNQIHIKKVAYLASKNLSNMTFIYFLYVVFATIGGLAIYIGHRALLKNVINPLKILANATLEFAGGTYDKRVRTDSHTEIGQVYDSFNKMAKTIQDNDERLRKFNEELEIKVADRTKELQKSHEELQRTQDALIRTEKIAAVGQIAAGVTHEIKNPLNSLSILTQKHVRELTDVFGSDLSSFRSIFLVNDEISRINMILEEFINYAKFPAPRFVEEDINLVIQNVIALLTAQASRAGVTISSSLDKTIPRMQIDPKQWKIVLINLFQNAIKAMDDGGTLDVKSGMSNGMAHIRIADTGCGIPEKDIEKIFTPFFSTRKAGLGLGLSIVHRIIESHGGGITCSSTVGEGTVFDISLPLERNSIHQ